jgi:hypothetical protein
MDVRFLARPTWVHMSHSPQHQQESNRNIPELSDHLFQGNTLDE